MDFHSRKSFGRSFERKTPRSQINSDAMTLAVKVLKGEFKDGSTVVVDAKADNIIFAKKEITAPTG
jgi:hypothetical protein